MADPDMFEEMRAAAYGEFSLSAALHGIDLTSDREKQLVEVAIAAGIVGALTVDRDTDEGSTRH